jgi:nucleoside-diphosphate-sugar epimerase
MILVTGASGFVGSALLERLARELPSKVRASVRREMPLPAGAQGIVVDGLSARTSWGEALRNVEVVIHCAARAHVMREPAANAQSAYHDVNVVGTLALAKQAAAAGVRRFIFISSIKVNGERTQLGQPFTESDTPAPEDAYGRSKAEAEKRLAEWAKATGVELVIIRPPLVYGAGAKGNFQSLTGWVARGLPLPLASVTDNRRSLVALDNLVDLIQVCVTHPNAANQTFLVSDGDDLSTAQLIRRVGRAMGKPARLIPFPKLLLSSAAAITGKSAPAQRLLGSLQVDIAKARHLLGWSPPISVDEGLRRAAHGVR